MPCCWYLLASTGECSLLGVDGAQYIGMSECGTDIIIQNEDPLSVLSSIVMRVLNIGLFSKGSSEMRGN